MPKTKSKKKGGKKGGNAPQIILSKHGKTQAQLLDAILTTMDEDKWITKAQGREFIEAMQVVIAEEIEAGRKVSLFKIVKLAPRLHTAGERQVNEEFGNPDSKKITKRYKAKVTLQATQGIFGKVVKDALPTPQKLEKALAKSK